MNPWMTGGVSLETHVVGGARQSPFDEAFRPTYNRHRDDENLLSRPPVPVGVVHGPSHGIRHRDGRASPSRCVRFLCLMHGIDRLSLGRRSVGLPRGGDLVAPSGTCVGRVSFTISPSTRQLLICFASSSECIASGRGPFLCGTPHRAWHRFNQFDKGASCGWTMEVGCNT
jgi:hypothetical protein